MDDPTRTIYDGLTPYLADHNRRANARSLAYRLRQAGYITEPATNQPHRVPRGGGDPYRDPWEGQ